MSQVVILFRTGVCKGALCYTVGIFLTGCSACGASVNFILIIYQNNIASSYHIFIKQDSHLLCVLI